MHHALQTYFERLTGLRDELFLGARSLRPEQVSFKSSPDVWSVAQVLQHLMLSEEGMLKQIGRPDVLSRKTVFPRIIGIPIYWMAFYGGMRVRSPVRQVLPVYDLSLDDVHNRWEDSRNKLQDYLETVKNEDMNKKAFFHPVRGKMTALGCLHFFELHLKHHREQIGRIKGHRQFPK